MIKPFLTAGPLDRETAKFQGNIANWIKQLLGIEILDGVLIEDQALVNGATTVNHLLGRTPSAMIVRSQSAAANIWFDRAAATTGARTVVVHSDAVCVADLYFFGG